MDKTKSISLLTFTQYKSEDLTEHVFKMYLTNLKGRKTERHITDLSWCATQVKSTNPGISYGQQGPKYWSQQKLFPKVHISRKPGSEAEPGWEVKYPAPFIHFLRSFFLPIFLFPFLVLLN